MCTCVSKDGATPDFPSVADTGEYLSRRDQIGKQKAPKAKAKAKNKASAKKTEAAASNGRGGRGKGRGRGRGQAKVMKKPAARTKKQPKVEQPRKEDVQEDAEEEQEEGDEVIEPEGAGSASSKGPHESVPQEPNSKRLRRSEPLPTDPDRSAVMLSPEEVTAHCLKHARERADQSQWSWEFDVRKAVLECLAECRASGQYEKTCKHTHRNIPEVDSNAMFSVYWSRVAAGMKIRASPSAKWIQVAYFSRSTPCVLTNAIIGAAWVCC